MGDSWHSYPKVYNLGHAAIADAFRGTVLVEEKVDGSQLSFGRFGDKLRIRSKNREFPLDAPDNLFAEAAATVARIGPQLRDGWTYRAEYLKRPRHNGLAYDRVPRQHVMVFDINTGEEQYLDNYDKRKEAVRLGLEVVPMLHCGPMPSLEQTRAWLGRVSALGGATMEGVVFKAYGITADDGRGKTAMGKHVSEQFREMQQKAWKTKHPTGTNIVDALGERYRTEARWRKAIQHLRERGALTGTPADIGPLLKEVRCDVEDECADDAKERLWQWARANVLRKSYAGLPEWYKDELLKAQWGDDDTR